jgi:hypothetical protein
MRKHKPKSRYFIMSISEWGTVKFIDDDLKYCQMDIKEYLKYCCDSYIVGINDKPRLTLVR